MRSKKPVAFVVQKILCNLFSNVRNSWSQQNQQKCPLRLLLINSENVTTFVRMWLFFEKQNIVNFKKNLFFIRNQAYLRMRNYAEMFQTRKNFFGKCSLNPQYNVSRIRAILQQLYSNFSQISIVKSVNTSSMIIMFWFYLSFIFLQNWSYKACWRIIQSKNKSMSKFKWHWNMEVGKLAEEKIL